ncbi:MAG: thioesterase family protein [Bryobacteraceae bacterium]
MNTIHVMWGEQDAFGHVNNVTYLRWAETARVAYLVRVASLPPLPPSGIAPILASVKCDYEAPVKYPDTIFVGARVTRIGTSSMQMEHLLVSQSQGRVVARVDSTLVLLDYRCHKPVPVPAEIRKLIGELEGRSFERDGLAKSAVG